MRLGNFAGQLVQIAVLAFLFIPITTASYAGLPPEKTNAASALINVARNLGGSIGVSLATTELAQRAQFHQARLTEHLAPSSTSYQQGLRRVTEHFVSVGSEAAAAQARAIGWLGQLVQSQASILAYIDVFWSFAIFTMLMIPAALMLRSVKSAPSH